MSGSPARSTVFYISLLSLVVVLSFWNLTFTKQYTTLAQWEIVNQAYTWYTYAARSIQHGILPLWDPYRFAGNSFIGEMQPGLFYPLKFALFLMPLDKNGLLSERAFNQFFVFSHLLAGLWMFALARHLKLGRLSSTLSGICFGLGGFLRVAAWPNIVDAMAWLPLIVLFSLRAYESERKSDRLFNACAAGAMLGMTFLAGSIHIAIMDAIVVGSLALYVALTPRRGTGLLSLAALVAIIGLVGALAGAIQLLPSLEYSPHAYRWFGGASPGVSNEKIPYPIIARATILGPKSIFALVLGEVDAGDSALSSYYGVMPLLLAIIGAWKYWNQRLTRYFVLLAALSFIYTWGGFSLLHGVLYLAPFLDIARESDRFIYLTQFSTAILAGFGSQALFEDRTPGQSLSLKPLLTILKWVLAIFAIFLAGISLGVKLPASDLTYLSFFFLLASFVLLLIASRQTVSPAVPFIALFLIAWDLYAYAPQDSKLSMAEGNRDHLAQLLYDRKLADFLKSAPDMPRAHFDAMESPNLGHAYGIPLTWSMSATMLIDYAHYYGHPKRNQLFNVRYTITRKDKPRAAPAVYTDNAWNVYENPDVLGRAWIVHQVEVDASNKRLDDAAFDLSQNATLQEPPSFPKHTTNEGKPGEVRWLSYQPNSLEVETTTDSPGMLILSEVFYPGWTCTVDGVPTKIYRADAVLRGVPVGAGTHRVSMRYRPASVMWGAAFSISSLIGILCWAGIRRWKSQASTVY